jgi:hypothetical protein
MTIITAKYILVVDDSAINQDDFICRLSNGEQDIANDEWDNDIHNDWKKIVAHLPIDNSPILDNIPLIDNF